MTKLFGTNGVRGVVNQDMNSELALNLGKAIGTYYAKKKERPFIAIGTDARISNHMLKSACISGLLSVGCNVEDLGILPTPTLQYAVKEKNYDAGVIITASHNPPQFNGIKVVDGDGTELAKEQEEEIEDIYFSKSFRIVSWDKVGQLSSWDGAIELYINGILSKVDVESIRSANLHVVLDCGNGAGGVVAPELLRRLGCKLTMINCELDGLFRGRPSEPIPENLGELMKKVKEVNADLGVAQDGDADRAIFIDENGNYVFGDQSLTMVARYIVRKKGGGTVVTPVSTSSALEDVVTREGGKVVYTKVGSPIVARVMKKLGAVFGGEENGGLIFPEHQYCRDSAMTIAKVLEILSKEGKKLSEIIQELPRYELVKLKTACPNEKKKEVLEKIKDIAKNENARKIDETDGVKIYTDDGWVLVRPSGTEPIFRIFAESKERKRAEELASRYKSYVERFATGTS